MGAGRTRFVGKMGTALGVLVEMHQPNTRMKPLHASRGTRGFTGWDLLIVVVTVLLAAGIFLRAMTPTRCSGGSRITCVSNIKQVGLAFRIWANDHGEKFPMALSTQGANAGSLEFNLTGEVWRQFQVISNELNNPKILTCPSDTRVRSTDWDDITNNAHLSYFVGIDADETRPQTILSGDRNLKSSTRSTNGVLFLKTGDTLEWTKELHNKVGNFGLADGSAMQINTIAIIAKQLESALQEARQPVHRLALPE